MSRVHFLVVYFKEGNIIARNFRQQILEKLTVGEQLKKMSAFDGTQNFVGFFVKFDKNSKPLYGSNLRSKLNFLCHSSKS
jgi:hypothetical protein